MNEFGLTADERSLIVSIFAQHPAILEARVFGSRAKGTHERSSDIDLTLFGNISSQLLAQIAGELDELPLPYHFDVNNYASIRDLAVKAHIDRIAQPIYHRATQTPARS